MQEPAFNMIPIPVGVTLTGGECTITGPLAITTAPDNTTVAWQSTYLADSIRKYTSLRVTAPSDSTEATSIHLAVDDSLTSLGEEGYRIEIQENRILISGPTSRGVFYGIQSLIQILRNHPDSIPNAIIEDYPRYRWRGMHLDVCRHFFDNAFIRKYIDLLATHKLNTFHWHLTEDQGWRVEIKKYPKLTEVGAWRKEEDGTTYGGFYTQDEIRGIVEYARRRSITIVPEIEMPGHALAALAAYPELSCTGGPFEVANEWGVFDDVYCAGKEPTFEFLQNVLDEIISLFPGKYIHIGGDECPKTRWSNCPDCQRRISEQGLQDENELQSYFIKRIEKYLISKGKRLIGWDEILEGGLAPEATVMSWRGIDGGVAAAQAGHDVIMSPNTHCYFDHYQARDGEPKAWGGFIPLEKVYDFDPTPIGIPPEYASHILGGQGNVWTEWMETPERVEYMTVPRVCAMSETLWSPTESRDWPNFRTRLTAHLQLLKAMNFKYRDLDR